MNKSTMEPEPQKNYPAFLKPYLADCSNRLQIPPAFTLFMMSSVPEKTSLRNCKGKLWSVEVAKIGDNFFFQQGWKKFIEENHIEFGDFLVCRYCGENIFDMKNLGKMASKIEINEAFDFNRPEEEKEPADDMLNETTLKRKHVELSTVMENVDDDSPYGYRKTGHTNGNPYFVIKLREHNPLGHLIVNASEIMNDNGVKLDEVMTVRDPCGRTWRSKVSKHRDGRVLLEEWDQLCKNGLDFGDECVCVIVEGKEPPYIQVHINRRKDAKPPQTTEMENVDEDKPTYKTGFMHGNPYFATKITKNNKGCLYIPSEIIFENDITFGKVTALCSYLKKKVTTLCDPYGLSWKSNVSVQLDGSVLLRGWNRVCERYNLRVGDEYVCEIVKGGDGVDTYVRLHFTRREADNKSIA